MIRTTVVRSRFAIRTRDSMIAGVDQRIVEYSGIVRSHIAFYRKLLSYRNDSPSGVFQEPIHRSLSGY